MSVDPFGTSTYTIKCFLVNNFVSFFLLFDSNE